MVRRSNNDRNEYSTNEALNNFIDALYGTASNVLTFLIIDTPVEQIQNTTNRERRQGNTQTGNTPIFIIRSLFRAANTNERETASSAFQSPHFMDFIQTVFNNIKKKEMIKKELFKHKPYTYKKSSDTEVECTVCLNNFKPREKIRRLNCDHEFHKRCIDKWLLEGNPCCPLCRKVPFIEEENK